MENDFNLENTSGYDQATLDKMNAEVFALCAQDETLDAGTACDRVFRKYC
jgi:hypothetical protein